METFLRNLEKNLSDNNNNKALEIFIDCLYMLSSMSPFIVENIIEQSIKKKYINVLKNVLDNYNNAIDPKIQSTLTKYFDITIIEIFVEKNLIDLDKLIRLSVKEYCFTEFKIIELSKFKKFFEKDKSFLILYASHFGYIDLLKILLNVIPHSNYHEHAIIHAINNKKIACFEILLPYINVNKYIIIEESCDKLFYNSYIYSHQQICPSISSKRGIYLLTAAIKKNNIESFNLLIDYGADIYSCLNDNNFSLINLAIINNNLELVKKLKNDYNINYEELDKKGNDFKYNPKINLSVNIENTNINIIFVVLINLINNPQLQEDNNYLDLINFILNEYNSNINTVSKWGYSPFFLFCSYEYYSQLDLKLYMKILDLLIVNGGDVNLGLIAACNNFKILNKCLGEKKFNIIEILLSKNADINYKQQFPILIYATFIKNYQATFTLLENGANPNIMDNNSNTSLNYLIVKPVYHYVERQLNFNEIYGNYIINGELSKKYVINSEEDLNNAFELYELLISYGADFNILDINNLSYKLYLEKTKVIIDNHPTPIMFDELKELIILLIGCTMENISKSIFFLFKIKQYEFEEYILPNIPSEYLCPISKYPLLDPVTASDGYTYCRKTIAIYLTYNDVSPVTKVKLNKDLVTNYTLKSIVYNNVKKLIDDYIEF